MKLFFALFLLLLISSCFANKKMKPQEFQNIRLHDIWALEKMNSKKLDPNLVQQIPYIEIHVKSKKIYGNNGCHEFSGDISVLDNEQISWSKISSKEKTCSKMELVNQFQVLFKKVSHYQLDGLKLFLFDKKKKTILQFKKVD